MLVQELQGCFRGCEERHRPNIVKVVMDCCRVCALSGLSCLEQGLFQSGDLWLLPNLSGGQAFRIEVLMVLCLE